MPILSLESFRKSEVPERPGGDALQVNAGNNVVAGAVQQLLPHPTNADILYAASVNGGIWKTENATSNTPDVGSRYGHCSRFVRTPVGTTVVNWRHCR